MVLRLATTKMLRFCWLRFTELFNARPELPGKLMAGCEPLGVRIVPTVGEPKVPLTRCAPPFRSPQPVTVPPEVVTF